MRGYEGYLHKKGGSKRDKSRPQFFSRRNWKRRYFVLHGATSQLLYYSSQGESEVLGVIQLKTCTAVRYNHREKNNCISFSTPGRDSFLVSADTEAELLEWIDALKLHIPDGITHIKSPDKLDTFKHAPA